MAKLKLIAEPTFKAPVPIPLAGGAVVEVQMTFRHRTKDALDEFIKSRAEKSDTETFMAMVEGWDLEDEFNAANVELLLQNYIGTALAAYRVYMEQLVQVKLKN